jgi:hypothetical protein
VRERCGGKIRPATMVERSRSPTSIFLCWAASVKFADDTNKSNSSITTHFAWSAAAFPGSSVTDRGS